MLTQCLLAASLCSADRLQEKSQQFSGAFPTTALQNVYGVGQVVYGPVYGAPVYGAQQQQQTGYNYAYPYYSEPVAIVSAYEPYMYESAFNTFPQSTASYLGIPSYSVYPMGFYAGSTVVKVAFFNNQTTADAEAPHAMANRYVSMLKAELQKHPSQQSAYMKDWGIASVNYTPTKSQPAMSPWKVVGIAGAVFASVAAFVGAIVASLMFAVRRRSTKAVEVAPDLVESLLDQQMGCQVVEFQEGMTIVDLVEAEEEERLKA